MDTSNNNPESDVLKNIDEFLADSSAEETVPTPANWMKRAEVLSDDGRKNVSQKFSRELRLISSSNNPSPVAVYTTNKFFLLQDLLQLTSVFRVMWIVTQVLKMLFTKVYLYKVESQVIRTHSDAVAADVLRNNLVILSSRMCGSEVSTFEGMKRILSGVMQSRLNDIVPRSS